LLGGLSSDTRSSKFLGGDSRQQETVTLTAHDLEKESKFQRGESAHRTTVINFSCSNPDRIKSLVQSPKFVVSRTMSSRFR
jgi:hypothetical protein